MVALGWGGVSGERIRAETGGPPILRGRNDGRASKAKFLPPRPSSSLDRGPRGGYVMGVGVEMVILGDGRKRTEQISMGMK